MALASVIPLRTVFGRRLKHQDRQRVQALIDRAGERVPGLGRLIEQMRRTRARSYSAGGPVH